MGLKEGPAGINPRIIELNKKKTLSGLSLEEEAELTGLYAFPDNAEAQALRTKECLAEKGIGIFTKEEKSQLQSFYSEKFQNSVNGGNRSRELTHEQQDTLSKDGTTSDDIRLKMLHTQAQIASLKEDWSGEPKKILDNMVDALPDTTKIYKRSELKDIPPNQPTEIELFMLSRLKNLPEFQEQKREGGILRVMESINCLRDQVRTKRFMQGVRDAVSSLEAKNEGEVYVVDAGCGAIPIMGIYAALSSPKARVTCIEYNPNSAKIAREVIKAFGLQKQIELVEGDATKVEPKKTIDLLISETMHSGLTNEPIVQILTQLQKFVKPEGLTLPNRVKVFAAIMPLMEYAVPQGYVSIGESTHHYVEPVWKEVADYRPGDNLAKIEFDLTTATPKDNFLLLTSEVQVGNNTLKPYETLITIPQVARVKDSEDPEVIDLKPGQKLHVSYMPGSELAGVTSIV